MLNIPVYRGKKVDSDVWLKGYYCNVSQTHFIIGDDAIKTFDADENRVLYGTCENDIVEIDPTTLAIHFPDMIDSEGNKIFASLSECGKGGDEIKDRHHTQSTVIFDKQTLSIKFMPKGHVYLNEPKGFLKQYLKDSTKTGIKD